MLIARQLANLSHDNLQQPQDLQLRKDEIKSPLSLFLRALLVRPRGEPLQRFAHREVAGELRGLVRLH